MVCIMGFYFGMYAFTASKKYLILSLLIPFLFHGFYNYLDSPYHYITLVGMVIYSIKLHEFLKNSQLRKKDENEKLKI